MVKGLKWILAALAGVFGLLLSFVVAPTLFECKLFTECHEANAGYRIVSIFSSEASSALANEQIVLQTAHSIAFTVVLALLGLALGAFFESRRRFVPQQLADEVPSNSTRIHENETIELSGVDRFSAYYLKIDAAELGDMSHGLSVGRDSGCSPFAIEDETISREHARLLMHAGHFAIADVGSTNGTKLNGRLLGRDEHVRLRSGDRLAFGSAVFTVRLSSAP